MILDAQVAKTPPKKYVKLGPLSFRTLREDPKIISKLFNSIKRRILMKKQRVL